MRRAERQGSTLEQPFGRFLCAGEIGDAPVRREWKARQPLGLQAIHTAWRASSLSAKSFMAPS